MKNIDKETLKKQILKSECQYEEIENGLKIIVKNPYFNKYEFIVKGKKTNTLINKIIDKIDDFDLDAYVEKSYKPYKETLSLSYPSTYDDFLEVGYYIQRKLNCLKHVLERI